MKTAVEWLANGLPKIDFEDDPYYRELFNIAKELEKQQIIDARVNGVCEGIDIGGNPITEDISKNHEIYYKETFNKQPRLQE